MKKILLLSLFFSLIDKISSQNLIPNPSFEEVTAIHPNWSGTFSKFNRWSKNWNSPTQGSPDILYIKNLDSMIPKRPKVDLAPHAPRTGKFMVGIKTYGCASKTLHCKEYIQVNLKEPLVTGEKILCGILGFLHSYFRKGQLLWHGCQHGKSTRIACIWTLGHVPCFHVGGSNKRGLNRMASNLNCF